MRDLDPVDLTLTASTRVALLEHFRTPYELAPDIARGGIEELRVEPGARALLWPGASWRVPVVAATIGQGEGIPIFARVLPDETIARILAARGGNWSKVRPVVRSEGAAFSSIWRHQDGSVLLPFDPSEVIDAYWSERYLEHTGRARSLPFRRALMAAYYRIRPALPRSLQISMRRGFASYQARTVFPGWPIETALHDFFDLVFAILGDLAGVPIPRISPWPDGYQWALVLTHDVEQLDGLTAIEPVLELEKSHGVRSSWNLIPSRYDVDSGLLNRLTGEGFEVGVHGFVHDGRDLGSFAIWRARLPAAHESAQRWGAVGFRSAALHRRHDWMRSLQFDYDSSSPDTDPFEPQDGGCCTWLPYFNGDLVELPVTLAQDHTLFVILREPDGEIWDRKARFLRERGGLALLDTHPDYLVDQSIFSAYERFLGDFAGDPTAWKALPREVSQWWRRRAASTLILADGRWQIVGPAAADGRVEFREDAWSSR